MKFKLDQLKQAMAFCSKAVHKNPVLAITEEYHLTCEKGTATLRTTDLENHIIVQFKIDSKKKFQTMIDPSVVNSFVGETIEFEDKGNRSLLLKYDDGSQLCLDNVSSADDFPIVPNDGALNEIFSARLFDDIINVSKYCTSDEMRPAMTGINIKCYGEKIDVTASDGHLLVVYSRQIKSEQHSFTIPKLFVKCITQFKESKIKGFPKWHLLTYEKQVSINSHAVCEFMYDEFKIVLYTRLIQQTYPDFNAVIPTEPKQMFRVDKKSFVDKLRRVLKYTNQTTNQIFIDLKEKQLIAKDDDFRKSYTVPFEMLSSLLEEPIEKAAFNCRLLIKALETTMNDEITMEFDKVTKPFTVRNKGQLLLIMPVIIY